MLPPWFLIAAFLAGCLSGGTATSIKSLDEYLQEHPLSSDDVVLNVTNKNLAGTIPTSLGRFINLTSLDLSSNQLTGTIPTWLGNLTGLVSLDLSRNKLTGPIPDSLGVNNMRSLSFLDVHCNRLNGTVPLFLMPLLASSLETLRRVTDDVVCEPRVKTGKFKGVARGLCMDHKKYCNQPHTTAVQNQCPGPANIRCCYDEREGSPGYPELAVEKREKERRNRNKPDPNLNCLNHVETWRDSEPQDSIGAMTDFRKLAPCHNITCTIGGVLRCWNYTTKSFGADRCCSSNMATVRDGEKCPDGAAMNKTGYLSNFDRRKYEKDMSLAKECELVVKRSSATVHVQKLDFTNRQELFAEDETFTPLIHLLHHDFPFLDSVVWPAYRPFLTTPNEETALLEVLENLGQRDRWFNSTNPFQCCYLSKASSCFCSVDSNKNITAIVVRNTTQSKFDKFSFDAFNSLSAVDISRLDKTLNLDAFWKNATLTNRTLKVRVGCNANTSSLVPPLDASVFLEYVNHSVGITSPCEFPTQIKLLNDIVSCTLSSCTDQRYQTGSGSGCTYKLNGRVSEICLYGKTGKLPHPLFQSFPNGDSKFQYLETVSIRDSEFENVSVTDVTALLAGLPAQLIRLDFTGCRLDFKCVDGTRFNKFTELKELTLTANIVSAGIHSNLSLPELTHLELNRCRIQNTSSLLSTMFPKLTNLSLSSNGLRNLTADLPNLQHLELQINKLSTTPAGLENLTDLLMLNLQNNQFRGEIPTDIYNMFDSTKRSILLGNSFLSCNFDESLEARQDYFDMVFCNRMCIPSNHSSPPKGCGDCASEMDTTDSKFKGAIARKCLHAVCCSNQTISADQKHLFPFAADNITQFNKSKWPDDKCQNWCSGSMTKSLSPKSTPHICNFTVCREEECCSAQQCDPKTSLNSTKNSPPFCCCKLLYRGDVCLENRHPRGMVIHVVYGCGAATVFVFLLCSLLAEKHVFYWKFLDDELRDDSSDNESDDDEGVKEDTPDNQEQDDDAREGRGKERDSFVSGGLKRVNKLIRSRGGDHFRDSSFDSSHSQTHVEKWVENLEVRALAPFFPSFKLVILVVFSVIDLLTDIDFVVWTIGFSFNDENHPSCLLDHADYYKPQLFGYVNLGFICLSLSISFGWFVWYISSTMGPPGCLPWRHAFFEIWWFYPFPSLITMCLGIINPLLYNLYASKLLALPCFSFNGYEIRHENNDPFGMFQGKLFGTHRKRIGETMPWPQSAMSMACVVSTVAKLVEDLPQLILQLMFYSKYEVPISSAFILSTLMSVFFVVLSVGRLFMMVFTQTALEGPQELSSFSDDTVAESPLQNDTMIGRELDQETFRREVLMTELSTKLNRQQSVTGIFMPFQRQMRSKNTKQGTQRNNFNYKKQLSNRDLFLRRVRAQTYLSSQFEAAAAVEAEANIKRSNKAKGNTNTEKNKRPHRRCATDTSSVSSIDLFTFPMNPVQENDDNDASTVPYQAL